MNKYPNLPSDVTVHICTKDNPMPTKVGDNAVELKQRWEHSNVIELEESMIGCSTRYRCLNCDHEFWVEWDE